MEEMDFEEMEKASAESPFVAKFQSFLETQCIKQIEKLVAEYPQKKSLAIDFNDLEHYDYQLADELIENPDVLIEAAEMAVQNIDIPMLELEEFKPHIRFFNLPKDRMPLLRDIGSEHIGKFISVDGLIRQMSDVLPKLKIASWQCRRCGNVYKIEQEGHIIKQPTICECKHKDFLLMEEQSVFVDYQKIQIQEPLEQIKGSEQATNIDVYVTDDSVNKAMPGDLARICGILRLIKPKEQGSVFKRYIDSVHIEETAREFTEIEISKEEEEEIKKLANNPRIYEMLTKSIAPNIFGHETVKEAIVMQLFGGVKKILPNGTTIRGNSHILLVGDPGCLVADERIVLGNGAIKKIGNIGQEHLQKINLQVLTGEGMKKRDLATVFHYYKNQQTMEIITESGKSIKGTPNHPLLCISKEAGKVKRCWKRLDEFVIGDKVAVTTSIPCTIKSLVPTGFKPIEYNRGPKFSGKPPEKLDANLAALLGYLVGDGWVRKYETGFVVAEPEKDILPKLLKKCKKLFGIAPSLTRRKLSGRTIWLNYATIHSNDIAQNLLFLREKRIPDIVLRSGNRIAAEFLKWLYEADGCVFNKGRGRRAVSFKAKNIELLRDMQMLLLRFAIHSRIIENALQIRRGKDIIKFAKEIGFVSKKKKTVLKKLAKEAKRFARFNSQRSEKIVKIILHEPQDVFDIEVPKGHRFIANGIISHNTGKSQTLQAVHNIAPKSIYIAGKTSTSAGISATAVKDEFGEGGWTLKAGALVLASGGMCMVDELDKMDAEDRSAMHESMEQGMISVAKAGIVTRFKTDTSILAAANPKFSRFDPHENFLGQIDLPISLISRFDLFFMIHDILDRKRDEETTKHILNTHMAGEISLQEKQSGKSLQRTDVEELRKLVEPEINSEILKKYISYTRQNVFPVLSKEAIQSISDYYVNLREKGKTEGTYSATPRQLEGLVRLSEASARVRLNDVVELQDTDRAIRLMRISLQDLVTDKETGKIDIDLITTGQSQSQVSKMKKILHVISSKAKEEDRVPVDEVIQEMSAENISPEEVRDIISKLKKKGDIYEPGHGFVLPTQKA